MPAMTALAMSHAPRNRIGLASGVFNASRQTGGALGVAVLGALLTTGSSYVSLHDAFIATAAAYVGGIALALSGCHGTREVTHLRTATQSPPRPVRRAPPR
jgi:MFS transporter, DHA2 family, methylenomycin A resistance protein